MLKSGKKFRALHDKKKNILTLVLSEKKFWSKQKTITPPFKLNGQSLIIGATNTFRFLSWIWFQQ